MIEIIFEDHILRDKLPTQSLWKDRRSGNHDRPFIIDIDNKNRTFELVDEIHQWFIDNNLSYKTKWTSEYESCLIFEKESDAILFKLTWL